jgi:hypothetical protein
MTDIKINQNKVICLIRNNFSSILFFVSFAVGPFVIIFTPENMAKDYVQSYSIANFIFSLFWTIIFTKENNYKLLIGFIYLLLIFSIVINILFNYHALVWIYVFAILMIDFLSSQTIKTNITVLNRILPILLLLLMAAKIINFDFFLWSRILGSLAFGLYLYKNNYEFHTLKIAKPIKFMLISFIFYSGSIILISFLLKDVLVNEFKTLMIVLQVGLVLLLKELDFKTRFNSKGGDLLFYLTKSISLFLPTLIVFLFDEINDVNIFLTLVVYYVSYFSLRSSRKYLVSE